MKSIIKLCICTDHIFRYVLDDKRKADRMISEANASAVVTEENPEILEDHDQAVIVNNMERNEEEIIPADEEVS